MIIISLTKTVNEKLPKLTVIVGPTASGKTEAGILLAKQINGAVISADSRQIYTDMNIGTAKPELASNTPHNIHTPDTIDNIKHYLFNVRAPDNQITLSEWQTSTLEIIDNLIEKNTPPLLVGGTMLYIDSIVFNYDIPRIKMNSKLRQDLEKKNTEDLFSDLIKQDPQAKDFVQPKNKRRIIRALEVIDATGKPFSQQRKTKPPRYNVQMIGLFPNWNTLSNRIQNRVQEMFAAGFIEEVTSLQKKYGTNLPLLQTINYKQVVAMLNGEITKEEATQAMIQANTRYARRQMSWWKGRDEITWIESPKEILQLRL